MNILQFFDRTFLNEGALETFLRNCSFCTLFLSMMFYWIQTAFSSKKKIARPSDFQTPSQPFLTALKIKASHLPNFGTVTMIFSNFLLMFLLIVRWGSAGHFPLSNLYESLMFLSWSCTVIHLILDHVVQTTAPTPFLASQSSQRVRGTARISEATLASPPLGPLLNKEGAFGRTTAPPGEKESVRETEGKGRERIIKLDATLLTKLIGSITSPSALFTNAFATFSLPPEMQKASPLVPALQSNWLMMHVTVMIISYSALILGSLLSIAFLILISSKPQSASSFQVPRLAAVTPETDKDPFMLRSSASRSERAASLDAQWTSAQRGGALLASRPKDVLQPFQLPLFELKELENKLTPNDELLTAKNNLAWNFDNLSYRVLGIGFPFLTIGILSGAVWANEAWGSYWSWDPKETWALLTWLIFAIYLHARITKGWQGKKPAIIASFGFLAIWVCFLGVNLIGEGLHSYGWFS